MAFDWIVLRLPGWGRHVRRIRRDWNHAREKALKKKMPVRKMLLERLDRIEEKVKMIEEQPLPRFTRKKVAKDVEIDLEEIKTLIKTKEEYLMGESYPKDSKRFKYYKDFKKKEQEMQKYKKVEKY